MATASDAIKAIARAHPSGDRLEFLAWFDDRVWEVVGGGPLGLRRYRGDVSSLNPQPLPPVDSGRALLFLVARGIIIVGGRDEGAHHAFLEDIDDWCGTGWPRRWPFPGPIPEPDPRRDRREDVKQSTLLGGALAAAELASRYPAGELNDLFTKASEQLTEAALG